MSKEHIHDYSRALEEIEPDNHYYKGGLKGFIVDECKCGHRKVVDYGDYKKLSTKSAPTHKSKDVEE